MEEIMEESKLDIQRSGSHRWGNGGELKQAMQMCSSLQNESIWGKLILETI